MNDYAAETNRPVIAVAGATGAVGEAMLESLAERLGTNLEVHALASASSLGKQVDFGRGVLDVEVLEDFDFTGVDYALFSAGGSVSAEHAPRACAAGAIVIDNTSEFRYRDEYPLVVPEVNGHRLDGLGPGALIANPNCSTIQMVVALAPIHRAFGIERINVATYQSVSGAGRKGMEELARQTADRLGMRPVEANAFPQPIAFNAGRERPAVIRVRPGEVTGHRVGHSLRNLAAGRPVEEDGRLAVHLTRQGRKLAANLIHVKRSRHDDPAI